VLGVAVALRSGNRVRYSLPRLATVKADDLTRITIERSTGSIELQKREGSWRILPEGYAADPGTVGSMVSALAELSMTALVSESESYSRYELDEPERIRVTAYAGDKEARRVDVGKQDEGRRSSFVLLSGDKRVWSSSLNLRSLFDKEKDKLRDMTVLDFQQDAIAEVVAKQGGTALELRKVTEQAADKSSSTTWKDASGAAVDQDKVATLLRTLARLRCQRYGEKGEALGKELLNVFLKAEDGTGYTVSFYEKSGGQYPGLSSGSDYPFYVAEYQYKDVAGIFGSAD
jgi:hypothetical protein